MRPKKNKNHYVPQFYIEGFADENGKVYVLGHKKNKINKQTKGGTFHKHRLYSLYFDKYEKLDPEIAQRRRESLGVAHVDISNVPEDPDMIENLLMDSENVAAPILQKLISRQEINNNERREFSMFIALMYTRNPIFLDFALHIEEQILKEDLEKLLSSGEDIKKIYEELKHKDDYKNISEENFIKILKESKFYIQAPRELGLQGMLLASLVIDTMIYQKDWRIIEASKGTTFITSDIPVFLDHPDIYERGIFSVGFETDNVKVVFPLSKNFLLVMENSVQFKKIQYIKVDKIMVKKLNKRIFERSGDYVIARDRDHIENLRKGFVPNQ